ncbi:ABC transporter ATP-binding protein [Ktedonobacter robiniae]|uniref:ABC transporter ATP-binding protein n=1 Tax=Ktedonobacter robiniae TaxID=2778365 RepID=A0ABQ3V7R5_9CHLR|nr:ABC transporter ATP-binding protein [Ktedonobacter robiniae]GHO60582.1 ABC transporter ATP-binding protein [Ktedonobacter robiniae]
MESNVIATAHLSKRYGKQLLSVDDLNLRIRKGEIYGFLGPNGAGKTTTLRMLLGLVRPTAGTGQIMGQPLRGIRDLASVGAMIESPAFYPYLSGWRNLRILAHYAGVPLSRVDTVLRQVALTRQASDPFKTYSLGMKQRLGVAAALLKDPELLILDEPTNGLDPQGMAEMRELICTLKQNERTVLLSSHLLNEVEQICDRVGVISHGKLIAEGTVAELRGQAQLLVRAAPLDQARRLAEQAYGVENVQMMDDALMLTISPTQASAIAHTLVTAGLALSELRPVERSLEASFMTLTSEEQEVGGKGETRQ